MEEVLQVVVQSSGGDSPTSSCKKSFGGDLTSPPSDKQKWESLTEEERIEITDSIMKRRFKVLEEEIVKAEHRGDTAKVVELTKKAHRLIGAMLRTEK